MSEIDKIHDLADVRWRVNVIISSRDLSRVLERTVYVELIMKDGKIESLEIPLSRFHILRKNIALLLQEVEKVKEKGTNIRRLMNK